MKLKWGKEKMYRISKEVPKAERDNDYAWWALFIVFAIMIVMFIIKVKG